MSTEPRRQETVWYYPRDCPFCGQDGELLICKLGDSRLVFRCAECFHTFDQPGQIDDADFGYGTEDLVLGETVFAPTREEIEEYGWGAYCIYSLCEDKPFS